MADEFQTGVCGGNWWNTSRAMFGSSPYNSSTINDVTSFGWSSDLVDMKPKSSDESDSVSDGSMVFQDIQKPHQLGSDWNQNFSRGSGRSESNYHHPILQEEMKSRLNYKQQSEILDCPQIEIDWSSNNLSLVGGQDSSFNGFKPINQGFSLDEPSLNSYPSKLLQSLFDTDPHEQSLYTCNDNQLMSNPTTTNYVANMNEFPSSFPKFSPNLSPSLPKQQSSNHFQLKNNNTTTPFWKSNAAALDDIRASFFPSTTQSQLLGSTFEDKPNFLNLTAKFQPNSEEVRDSNSAVKKSGIEPAFKRPRIETPSPLPTFKVRKEKLGDRITALQQLVSPFGKTDTASVLHEAIDYIKFLHDQVNVLSTPYMKNGPPNQYQQQSCDKLKDNEGPKQDLRSRGLCLVPVSSTFPVANETTHDLWTPTFGGSFR